MHMQRQMAARIFAWTACGVLAVGGIWWGAARYHAAAEIAERQKLFDKFGLVADATHEFIPLPSSLTHNRNAARLGETLFVDKRLARSPYRVCGACHRLNEGGIDAHARSGKFPRTVYNAIFADVFLHDGSIIGMPALVRHMIESPDFCAGGPLSNIVARLAADEKTVRQFQFAYEDGVTASNVVDALVQYQRTLFTPIRAFDLWCAGHSDALDDKKAHGLSVFRRQKCTSCHYGPALGLLKVADGKKVPGLRGLGTRQAYLPDARTELGAVLALMPNGNLDAEDRAALVAFLKAL